jgi:hypothetical protein
VSTGVALAAMFISLCIGAATRSTWYFSAFLSGIMLVDHWVRELKVKQ